VDNKIIFLVEDNPDDEALALRTLKKNNISNQVIVARDGAEALDCLWVPVNTPEGTPICYRMWSCWT